MKTVSVDELKRHLSSVLRSLQGNEAILVTRHSKTVARLSAAGPVHVHRGSLYGQGKLKPVLKEGTNGRYLDILVEDRQSRPER